MKENSKFYSLLISIPLIKQKKAAFCFNQQRAHVRIGMDPWGCFPIWANASRRALAAPTQAPGPWRRYVNDQLAGEKRSSLSTCRSQQHKVNCLKRATNEKEQKRTDWWNLQRNTRHLNSVKVAFFSLSIIKQLRKQNVNLGPRL